MNLFQRAFAGLNLTPGERAFLKLVDGVVISAVLAGLTAAAQIVSAGGAVDWRKVAVVGGVAFATSLVAAFKKYFTAQGDAPVAAVADMVESKLESVSIPFTAPHSMTATVGPASVPVNTNSASSAPASGV